MFTRRHTQTTRPVAWPAAGTHLHARASRESRWSTAASGEGDRMSKAEVRWVEIWGSKDV